MDVIVSPPQTPFVGRAAERERLTEAIDSAIGGSGGVLAVTGEAGVGKSRLLADVLGDAGRTSVRVVRAQCYEAGHGIPYAPLIDVAREAGATEPLLRSLLNVSSDPDQRQRAVYHLMDEAVAAYAAGSALIVAIEDLHWCDEASLDFLVWFAGRLPDRRVLALLTWRQDELTEALARSQLALERQRLLAEIRLHPFASDDVERMLRVILDQTHLVRADVVDFVHRLTDGNPFFIEEVLRSSPSRMLREGDLIEVPRTVQAAVQRRVDGLSAQSREVLSLAAVAGREFDFSLLQELTGIEEASLLASIRELVSQHLVVEQSAERLVFRHALTQEAVLLHLLTRERRHLHGRVAAALQARGAPASTLGHHWFMAEQWERATPYLVEAGERALTMHSPGAALALLHRAVEAAGRAGIEVAPRAYLARARAHDRRGDFDAARQDYERAGVLAGEAGDAPMEWRATVELGLLWASRDYRHALVCYQQALELARQSGDAVQIAESLNYIGNWETNADRPRDAIHRHEEALALLDETDAPAAGTLDLLALATAIACDLDGSSQLYRRVLDLVAERDLPAEFSARVFRAASGPNCETLTLPTPPALAAAWQPDTARALEIARMIEYRPGEAYALLARALGMAAAGRVGEALASVEQAVAIAEEVQHVQWTAAACAVQAVVQLELLDADAAVVNAQRAFASAGGLGSRHKQLQIGGALAWSQIESGALDDAHETLQRLLPPSEPPDTLGKRLCWWVRGRLAVARGESREALEIADALIATATGGSGARIPLLSLLRGEALALGERLAEAEQVLEAAVRWSHEDGLAAIEWRARLEFARVLRLRSTSAAGQEVERAAEVVRRMAAGLPPAEAAEFLERAAQRFPGRSLGHASRPASPDGLTRRELEVLELLVSELSTLEIAERLVLSKRTVERHTASIYAKVGASGRTARASAVAYAYQHGIVAAEQPREPLT